MLIPFQQAVDTHGPTVLRVCMAVLGPGSDAEDAWSDTFLAALGKWPDLPDTTNVEAYLVTVAHRKALDIIRRRQRHAIPTDPLPEQPSTLPGPGDNHTDMWAAVCALPERQRLAIAYHYFGGLPHTETAALLGSSAAAVRKAASEGLSTLRRTLANWQEG